VVGGADGPGGLGVLVALHREAAGDQEEDTEEEKYQREKWEEGVVGEGTGLPWQASHGKVVKKWSARPPLPSPSKDASVCRAHTTPGRTSNLRPAVNTVMHASYCPHMWNFYTCA
jgi:hypothetical protein